MSNDDDVDCDGPTQQTVSCVRTAAGVNVALAGGNDLLGVVRAGADRVTVDAGSGSDTIRAQRPPAGTAPTGQWGANLGSGNDTYEGSDGQDIQIAGESGNDTIKTFGGNDVAVTGGDGNDTIDTGAGNDSINAGGGDDVMFAGGDDEVGDVGDTYAGGPGFDVLDWSERTSAVIVILVGEGGGASGEDDQVVGVEKMLGGNGNDSFLGYSSEGGQGDDVLTGDNGNNTIKGGPGSDVIRGFGGNDQLIANDDPDPFTRSGAPDTRISCSTGTDKVFLDLTDPNPDDAQNCELIDRRAIREEAATVIASSRARLRDGRLGVKLRCPRKVGRACAGELTLEKRGGGREADARYSIRRGGRKTVRVALAGVRRGQTVIATSTETGRHGVETVSRHLTVR
jgi:RTX calcium-binding nonapeptide repeat (4 copies)